MFRPMRAIMRRLDLLIDRRIDEVVRRRPFIWGDPDRVEIAPTAVINDALLNVSSGRITIGEWAMLGHHVSLLTGAHVYTLFNEERMRQADQAGRDISVDEGAWLASNVTVVGPCRIGKHAVVAAGSVVTKDVPPYAIAAGNPAAVIGSIPHDEVPK
jgi:acetyltransferase-like isoleucine patch superfamily enzyme